MNEDCYQSCPATTSWSGVGLWGRRCLDPFTCQGGSIVGSSVTFGCKCALPDNAGIAPCHICDHRAGEIGEHCAFRRRLLLVRCSPASVHPRTSAGLNWLTRWRVLIGTFDPNVCLPEGTRCNGGKFLYENRCRENCDGLTGMVTCVGLNLISERFLHSTFPSQLDAKMESVRKGCPQSLSVRARP